VKNGFGFYRTNPWVECTMMTTPPTLTVAQRRALHAMGIDYWRLRSRAAQTSARDVSERAHRVDSAPPVRVPSVEASVEPIQAGHEHAAAPAMHLDGLAAPGVVLLGVFDAPADGRFALDVVQTIAGPDATPQRTQFRWPQTQTTDASLAAAGNAYMGFVRGQTERAAARCLVLLGTAAGALLDSSLMAPTCAVVAAADVAELRGDPAGKRELWQAISPYCRR